MTEKSFVSMLLMGLLFTGVSYAQDADQGSVSGQQDQASGDAQPHHHTPSQAAIDACAGKSEGDACDYTNSKGEDKSGTCANTSDGQTLFCKRSRPSS